MQTAETTIGLVWVGLADLAQAGDYNEHAMHR